MPKILIVDDSSFQRKLIRNLLTNYEIVEASTGREALNYIAEIHFDCMLLDIVMPDINGIEVLETLYTTKPNLPIIVITADIQETTRKQCFDFGAADVINKPKYSDNLVSIIENILHIV